jgi:hypothetical protein
LRKGLSGRRRAPVLKEIAMQLVMDGYRGLSLLVRLNWDALFTVGTVIVGLLAGAFLGSAIVHP